MFDHSAWRPAGVVVVGSDHDINAFTWQLEKVLPVPVFAQTMAQVTVARGAALAAAQSTEFTDAGLVADAGVPTAAPRRRRRLSYTGAVTALTAATVTFVTSLSLAVGLQLVPDRDPGKTEHVVPPPPPQAAQAVAPSVAPPPAEVKPAATAAPQPAPQGEQPARLTSDGTVVEPGAEPGAPDEQPSGVLPLQDPNNRSPQLTRVLEHIPGAFGESGPRPPE
jgi:hypothetical protein